MPRRKFQPSTSRVKAADIIRTLAAMGPGLIHQDGPYASQVNVSAFGRYVGLPAATISRIVTGPDDRVLSSTTCDHLSRAFGLTFAQVRGEAPIRPHKGRATVPTDAEIAMLQDLRSLPPDAQRSIVAHIVTQAAINRGAKG